MSGTGVGEQKPGKAARDDGVTPRLDLVASGVVPIGAPLTAPGSVNLSEDESDRFLRIVSEAGSLRRNNELVQFLQSAVQYFLPHEILIAASGDFRASNLALDVISSLPGVRTRESVDCRLDVSMRSLHAAWAANGRQALLLERPAIDQLLHPECNCALRRHLPSMKRALAHGCRDARSGRDSLYLALSPNSIVNLRSMERFRLLADPLFTQIDIAFRRITTLELSSVVMERPRPSTIPVLSAREESIFRWVTAGKTNAEIAKILAISSFTVKNHVQRIMKKLDAANRTEAVAKYRQMRESPQPGDSAGNAV